MFDANIMCDSILEDMRRIDYHMSLDNTLTVVHQNIDKYEEIFIGKSTEDKKLLMKECCCLVSRLSATMLFDHDIDLTLNDCAIGVTSNISESDDKSVNNVDNDNDSIDNNTCVKCGKHIVVVCDRNELENDNNIVKHKVLTKDDEIFAEYEMWANDEEPTKNIKSEANCVKKKNKSKRRSTNKTGFPKLKKKFSGKNLANTKKEKPSSNPITDNLCDLNKIYSNSKTSCLKKESNKCDRNSKRKDVESDSDNENNVKQLSLVTNAQNDKTKAYTKNKIKKQSVKCFNETHDQKNNNLNGEEDDDQNNDENEDEDERHVKFMGSTFRARDLMKKCNSCNPKCELDELTLAFYVMMNCENDDDLPRDLQKHCRIDSSSNSESSDCDNNDQQITDVRNAEQICVNSSCGDFNDDLDIVDVNEIYAAEKECWFSNDVLNDGVNDFLAQTSNSTYTQSLPFDPSLQSFVSQPSTSGYGKTGFGAIINNVHTMSQQIIINSVMPPVSSTPSSDLLHSELPADLADIALEMMVDSDTDMNCNFDAISTTINNAGINDVTQSEVTSGKSVTANDEQTLDESLVGKPTETVISNDKITNDFRCKYCEYTCEIRNDMKTHCQTVHPGRRIMMTRFTTDRHTDVNILEKDAEL